MKAETRRKLEMGRRALSFSKANPDASTSYTALVARLEEGVGRADVLAQQQRAGITQVRGSTTQKRALRTRLRQVLLAHVAHVARLAAAERPELEARFRLPPENQSFEAFRIAARVIATEARAEQDLLARHGLTESLLAGLEQALGEFDAAVDQATTGKRAHIGARADLDAVLADVVGVVRVLGDINRDRFATKLEQLAAWEAASDVAGPFRTVGDDAAPISAPPSGGDAVVKPAA